MITITGKQSLVDNTLNLASNPENIRAGSLARIGHEPPKLGVAGSSPAPPAILSSNELDFEFLFRRLIPVPHAPT
jgi:hypothetical protein